MTDARYVVSCCGQTVAEIEISGHQATIRPPDGEDLYRVKPPPRVEDPKLTAEQMAFEYRARDKIHGLTMDWTIGHHVSEVLWPGGPSWVIRCDCGQTVPVGESNLPKVAQILTSADWSATGGVVLLGVLHAAMTRSGI